MKEALLIIILLSVTYLVHFFKKSKNDLMTEEDIKWIESNKIIKNKEYYTKKTVQKAQQFIDVYLSNK